MPLVATKSNRRAAVAFSVEEKRNCRILHANVYHVGVRHMPTAWVLSVSTCTQSCTCVHLRSWQACTRAVGRRGVTSRFHTPQAIATITPLDLSLVHISHVVGYIPRGILDRSVWYTISVRPSSLSMHRRCCRRCCCRRRCRRCRCCAAAVVAAIAAAVAATYMLACYMSLSLTGSALAYGSIG